MPGLSRSWIVGLAWVACLSATQTQPVLAAAPHTVRIVVDRDAHHAVAGAVIDLIRADGSRARIGTTDAAGTLVAILPYGVTVEARADGTDSARGVVTAPSLHLRLAYHVIATIEARAPLGSAHTVTRRTAETLVAGNLRAALRLDPRYRSAAEGGSDEAMVNGIPLPLPASGSSAGAGHFSTDLFASETPSDPNGSSVPNFHLVNPTVTPQASMSMTLGSFGENTWRSTFSGRRGSFGYGLALAAGGDGGTLDGQHLRDLSGISYDHTSNARHLGASLNTSFSLGKTSLSFSAIGETRNSADIPTVLPGSTPIGYGPETALPSHDLVYWLTADRQLGALDAFYVGVHYGGGATIDHSHALFAGAPAAFHTTYAYDGTYQELKLTRSEHNVSYYAQSTLQTFRLNNDQGIGENAVATSSAIATSLGFERSAALSYGASVGVHAARGAIAGSSLALDAHARYLRGSTTLSLSASSDLSQDQESFGAPAQVYAQPQSALVDCSAGTANIGAPSATGAHPRRVLVNVTAAHRIHDGELSAGGYYASEQHALVNDIAEAPLVLPSGYGQQLQAFFAASCGGTQLAPEGVLGTGLVSVPSLQSREAFVAARRTFGHIELSGFYETLSQYATGTPSVQLARSSIVPGSQVVSVPLQRANLLVAYHDRRSMLAADALYTAANNADRLPGHVELMLGAATQVGHGTLSLALQNPFGAYGGLYTSSRYAVPIRTTAGPLPTLADPVLRTWQFTYRFSTSP